MFVKPLYILSFLFLFFSCKKEQEENTEAKEGQEKNQVFTEQDVAKLKYIEYALDPKTEETVTDWAEFMQIQDLIATIKKGDISYFKENEEAILLLIKELKVNVPESLNSASITARLLVLETKILKLESLANLLTTTKAELLEHIREFFVAHYTLVFQMNKKVEFDDRNIERP
ncbi:hypothetical protein [uncultured Algibacter sp.]|uniref:hypothetical protein n=1 Tax=uncultured Algibacter sp. TaxID=298659 RepID=UPI00262FEE57|nr:hypothetical protein [uncultured Algibacter sp.]